MASMAFRVILTATLCCLSYSQSLEELLIGSVRGAMGEMKALSQSLTELHDRMTVMEGHMVELQASSKSDSILQTRVQNLEMERDLHRDVFNSTCKDQVAILQESFSTEMGDRVTTKLGELHDRMTVMEGHMVELQASSKPDSILQTCVQILEMERALNRDVFNSTCRDQVAILQESFSTELEKMDQSIEGCSSKVTNLHELLTTDECATKLNDCSENASCKDAFVEYTCDCLAGYQGDGFTCEDVDECTTDNHRCHGHAHCNNSIGNYTCSCLPGFTGDGFHCEDVDECNSSISECHSQAHCNNSIGNYTCSCLPGFSGDGFSCKGSPCVSPSHLIPTLGCITPVLEEMIWEDAKKNCLEQGGRLLEKISTHTEMKQLKEHFGDFLNDGRYEDYAWLGMRGNKWIEGGDLLDASPSLWHSNEPTGGDTNCAMIYLIGSPALYDFGLCFLQFAFTVSKNEPCRVKRRDHGEHS